MNTKLSVLGAGSWGTALAILAARNGCQTLLWGHEAEHIANLKEQRQNQRYLPDLLFPETLAVTADLQQAVEFSDTLLLVVPSHAFDKTLENIKPFINDNLQIAWATKGFNHKNGVFLHESVENILSPQIPTAVISGPTFAQEVAANLPTALTIASLHNQFSSLLSSLLRNSRFRVYTSNDLIGVQVGGAVKNVLAIATGIADGLELGANTRAALITRGLTEITRLGVALGGQAETFMGLAGLGDLILTCTDNQSRNRRFGLALGKGGLASEIIAEIDQEVEGISAAKETHLLAKHYGIEMPIVEQIYQVLYQDLSPIKAVQNLLNREPKQEACS